jgi:hypothetical protein
MAMIDDILEDMSAGKRTKAILADYNLSVKQLAVMLQQAISDGLLTKSELKQWRENRSVALSTIRVVESLAGDLDPGTEAVELEQATFVVAENDNNWEQALRLFNSEKSSLVGAHFTLTTNLRYHSFVVDKVLFRSKVPMVKKRQRPPSKKAEDAMEFIATHGWEAYLEDRAFAANFERFEPSEKKATLAVVRCKDGMFLAAVYTGGRDVNFYAEATQSKLKNRLSSIIDTSKLVPRQGTRKRRQSGSRAG